MNLNLNKCNKSYIIFKKFGQNNHKYNNQSMLPHTNVLQGAITNIIFSHKEYIHDLSHCIAT